MQLYLVRSARAEKQSSWQAAGGTRPLTAAGVAQSQGLVELLGDVDVETLACGPALRSRETLAPLAEMLGKPLHVDDRLDIDAPVDVILARVRELAEQGAVVCLHRAGLMAALERILGAQPADLESRCERGAAWIVAGDPPRGTYFAPRRTEPPEGVHELGLEPLLLRKPDKRGTTVPRVAVLDLGSTSFHLLVAEWSPLGELRRVARERIMLRMGRELHSGPIGHAMQDRCAEAVRELGAAAVEHKADELVVVATAGLREASNGAELLTRLETELGGPVRLLSGEEEAHIIHRAIRSRLRLSGRSLGLDLGGGSLELVVGSDEQVLYEATLPLGVVRLHGEIGPHDPPTDQELGELRERLRQHLDTVRDEIRELAPRDCVAVGGTSRALGRLILTDKAPHSHRADRRGLCGMRMSRATLGSLARELAAATQSERLERPGMNPRRADLLPFGAEVLGGTLSQLGFEGLTLCDWGLREGVLLEMRQPQNE